MTGLQFALDNHAVAIVSERGEYQRPIGSGFFLLRPDRLITAKHVVSRDGLYRNNLTLVHPSEPTLSLHFLHPEPYAEPGHSGGPVLGDGGTVVGVIVESFVVDGKTFARATGLHPLVALLDFPNSGSG